MKYKIPFIRPNFPDPNLIAGDIKKIVSANWYTNFGPYEQKLRQECIRYLNHDVSICTTSNATLALDVAIKNLFFPLSTKKRKVIILSFTFVAGGEMILANGMEPVFIDIDDNWQPDIEQAREYLESHSDEIAGILLCNTFGVGNVLVKKWEELATLFEKRMIIDSAAGFGSLYENGEKIGARGDCEIFSLHATKPFSVGEGGLISSKNKEFIEKCREATNFGFSEDRKATHLGTNAKLGEIYCAIGVRQLARLDEKLSKRRASYAKYKNVFESLDFKFQKNMENSTIGFVPVEAPDAEFANKAIHILQDNGVQAQKYYDPLTNHPLFDKYEKPLPLHMTNRLYERIICLPLHDDMDDKDIFAISRIIGSIS